MSFLPFGPAKNAGDYFKERTEKLVRFNEVRLMEILESFQYGIGYILVCFFLGVSLDFVFPKYDEQKDTTTIFAEVVLQCLALILFVFYGRKIVKIMPFLFNLNRSFGGSKSVPHYKAYQSTEYEGEVIIGFVLVATQTNLLKKIDHISKALYAWLFNAKRDAVVIVKKDEEKVKEKVQDEEKVLEKDFGVVEKDVKAIEQALR